MAGRDGQAPPRRTVADALNGLDAWQARVEAEDAPYATDEWKARARRTIDAQRDRLLEMDPDDKLMLLGEALESAELDESAKWVIRWQHRDKLPLSEFEVALLQVATVADDANLNLLSLGYPELVAGIREWRHGDLARRLRSMPFDFSI